MEWNDPDDIALVSRVFDAWADAVIAKDGPRVESFHDDGFRARIGDRLIDKARHISIELGVAVREMSIVEITATRRLDDLLLVWSKRLIRADAVPELPELGLTGDWGDRAAAKSGFVQNAFHRLARCGRQPEMPGVRSAGGGSGRTVRRAGTTRFAHGSTPRPAGGMAAPRIRG